MKFIQELLLSQQQRVRGFQPLRRKEIYSGAVAFATATCPSLKARRRNEIYSEATSFEVATCQGLKPLRRKEIYSEAVVFAGSNVSGAKAPATQGNLFRSCCIRNSNVSTHYELNEFPSTFFEYLISLISLIL